MHHGLAEMAQTAHRLNPALETQGAVTFRPGPAPLEDWNAWCAAVWSSVLDPALSQALELARAGRLREAAALDLELAGRLSPEAARRSRAAGRRILESSGGLRGEKMFARFLSLLNAERAEGHLVIVHALRAAAFHVTGPAVAGSYLYQEAVGGLFPNHPGQVGACVEKAMWMERAELPALRVA